METLAHHILDLLINSINANATFIKIIIIDSQLENIFSVQIEDNGDGFDKSTLKNCIKHGFTTNKGHNRGQGLFLIDKYCKICNGNMFINNENKKTIIHFSFKNNHINKKPLGDIAGVVANILYSHKNLYIIFKYIVDNSQFAFDSNSFKKEYNKVYYQSYEMLQQVKQHINQNINNIL